MKLTREVARRFEDHIADLTESLLRASLAEPDNREGYAFHRDGDIRATCSTNPYARWANMAFHLNRQPPDAVERAVAFFQEHGTVARARIIPDGFSPEQADVLSRLGLRHTGFHTVLWAPLDDLPADPTEPEVDIREASTPEQIDDHIRLQLACFGVPEEAIAPLQRLRRHWWGIPELKFYLAYVEDTPVAQAILDCRDGMAYLASAGTLSTYRRRGLHHALIHRRLADARELGCRIVMGAADFENNSLANQMDAGLGIAYTAAWWCESCKQETR